MKRVLMTDTARMIFKSQKELNNFLALGYKVKKTKDNVEYLVRKED